MRQTSGTRKEQIKDEGKSSRLRPQAEQIHDSAAAGSSLRQDNRANCGRKKIRPVNSAVHPWMCVGRRVQKGMQSPQYHCSAPAPVKTTLPRKEAQTPPLLIRWHLWTWCCDRDHESFLLFKYFFSNFAHGKDTGSQPPKQANTL